MRGGENMKKIILGISLFSLVLLALVFYSTAAFAGEDDNNDNFNAKTELKKSKCINAVGKPVIKVTQKVRNDIDSGFAGNYWAFDYYKRYIEVWSTGGNTYCAIVKYDGEFYAVPGQVGPGNNPSGALIDSPVHGDMDGGRRASISGTLLSSPSWPTSGSVGTTNYQCNIITNNCPGLISWPGQYFSPGFTYNDDWWGWQYKKDGHGTWTNAIDVLQPDSGNIL